MDHKTNIRMMAGVLYQIFCHHIHRGWRHTKMDRRCLADFDHFSFRTADSSLIYNCTKIFQLFDLHSFLRFPFSYLYRNYFLFI